MSLSVEITKNTTELTITEDTTTVNITPNTTTVEVKGISIAQSNASGISTAHAGGSRLSGVSVQASLDEISNELNSVSAAVSAAIAANQRLIHGLT